MSKNEFGLAFMILSSLMWLQSFTYAVRGIDFTLNLSQEISRLFFTPGTILSFVIAIMCAVMGIMLMKLEFDN